MRMSIRPSVMVLALLAPATLQAQDTGSKALFSIEEIVVTAEKREANLQNTAVAISAFSGETLERRGIDDVSNLQSYIPNLHVGQEQDGFKIAMRGIGLQGTTSISDSGVAFYNDGFYIPRPAGGSAVFYDISRVEVLKGPQGTLYGRNATGGVVNVISNAPSDEFEGEMGFSYGNRDLVEMRGILNIPLSETVSSRFSLVHTEEDGYVKNNSGAPGTRPFYGTDGDLTMRGQLQYDNKEDLKILLALNYSKLNGTGIAMKYLERNIGGPGPTQALLATVPTDPADPLVNNSEISGYNDTETTYGFLRVEKSFGGVDAFLQAGKFWQDTNILQDFDGSPVEVSLFNKDQENEAESVEFRLASNTDGPLEWMLGAYYFSEDTYIFRRVRLNGLVGGGTVFINLPDFLLDEYGSGSTKAAFSNVKYALSDTFRLSGGIRYTKDKKSGSKITRGNFGAPFPPDLIDVEVDFSQVTWKAGIEWDASEDVFVYASASTGYKAGGFNISSSGAPYDAETVDAYEVGIKSNPFDGRMQINADAFYYSYNDMQLTTLTTVNNAPGQLTTNAAGSTLYGLEIDTQFEITENLLMNAAYSYISAKFDEYYNTDPRDPNPVFNPGDPEGLGRTDLAGNTVPYVANHTISVGLQYGIELGDKGSIVAAINSSWHSELFMREYNDPLIDRQAPNTKTDATITYYAGDSGLSITGYVTNIENDTELNNIFVSPGFVGLSATASYTKPRSFGVRLDYEF
ncbi:TonB-dependent receptor [Kordiimonas pumila]|uniref:TonB-dependent receptor n=1 Tax=Kordiimonas pumila TaxID=2161677 RepID=A0ABV7D1A7_9PROT|nr:TonB-dependent receptor [Kordiimonas pumila]